MMTISIFGCRFLFHFGIKIRLGNSGHVSILLNCIIMAILVPRCTSKPLQWRHNERGGVSNYRCLDCFIQPFVQAQIKENIKAPRHWSFVRGIDQWPVETPHKGPVMWKMFPFDDVIVYCRITIIWATEINSFWPTDVIWRHGAEPKLTQVMVCCLTVPSHYLNQCWRIINGVLWHSDEGNFTSTHELYPQHVLTHFPLDKMAAISQTIFSDAFSWMKNFVFWLKFHWSLLLRVQLAVTQHWFR